MLIVLAVLVSSLCLAVLIFIDGVGYSGGVDRGDNCFLLCSPFDFLFIVCDFFLTFIVIRC